jgi:hypothetical protein
LDITAYVFKQYSFNPFPALIEELKKTDEYLAARKLLRSFSLLGFQKKDMSETERTDLLDALPLLLTTINKGLNEREKAGYIATFLWVLARLNFNFSDLENRIYNKKAIVDHIHEFYTNCQNGFMDMRHISIFLWAIAVINVPNDHELYKIFMENSLKIIEACPSKKNISYSIASRVFLSQIAYQFKLSKACIEHLKFSINKSKPSRSSLFHLKFEKIIIKLLNEERGKDQTIPYPPKNMTEYKIPGSYGAIVADTALDTHFVIEFDGVWHANKESGDKFKDRLYEALGIHVIRIVDNKSLKKMSSQELNYYLKEKVIKPYLEYHQEKMRKKLSITEVPIHLPLAPTEVATEAAQEIQSELAFQNPCSIAPLLETKQSIESNAHNNSMDFFQSPVIAWEKETPLTYSQIVKQDTDIPQLNNKNMDDKKRSKPATKKIPVTEEKSTVVQAISVLTKVSLSKNKSNTLERVTGQIILPLGLVAKQSLQHNVKKQPAQPKKTLSKDKDKNKNLISGKKIKDFISQHINRFLEGRPIENVDKIKKQLILIAMQHTIPPETLEKALENNLFILKKTTGCLFFKKTSFVLECCEDDFRKNLTIKPSKKY